MTFTLHDLTDFYIERVTAHRIKTKLKRIGRIGSERSLLTLLRWGAARERHYYEAKLISI